MSLEAKQVQEFLQALTQLSREHGIAIGGCGCCGSPYFYDADGDDFRYQAYGIDVAGENLEFDYKYKTLNN